MNVMKKAGSGYSRSSFRTSRGMLLYWGVAIFIVVTVWLHLTMIDGGEVGAVISRNQSWIFLLDGVCFGLYFGTAYFATISEDGNKKKTQGGRRTTTRYNAQTGSQTQPYRRPSRPDVTDRHVEKMPKATGTYRIWRSGDVFRLELNGYTYEDAALDMAERMGWTVAEDNGTFYFVIDGNRIPVVASTSKDGSAWDI